MKTKIKFRIKEKIKEDTVLALGSTLMADAKKEELPPVIMLPASVNLTETRMMCEDNKESE